MQTTSRTNRIQAELGPTQLVAVSSLNFLRSFRNYKTDVVKRAARFIETFGIRLPILVDAQRNVVAGEIWALAARHLELPEVPALFVEGLSTDQLNAYRIGIQRIPELGNWDEGALGEIFKDWGSRELDFDFEITGFAMPEIDAIMTKLGLSDAESVDEQVPSTTAIPVTSIGDVWEVGRHRIVCGSALAFSAFETLFGADRASVVITDPPYNVAIEGHVGGKGSIHHREFAMASGEMSEAQFEAFLLTVMKLLVQFSTDGSLHYLFMDWRHAQQMLNAGSTIYLQLKNIIAWVKSNAGMGSLYRSQHELVFLFKHGKAPHRNNVELGKHGRNRTNVWSYAGATSLDGRTTDEGHLLAMHPTVKPVQMIADAMLDSSARGEIVLDCFLGSGSTLMAAERVGRRLYGIEIDPIYVDLAIRRWQRQTGQHAIHSITRRSFDETENSCRQ